MKRNLPIFDIALDDEDLKHGVGMISLVDSPAIGVNWIKLAKQNMMNFKADKEKQLLYGPFLIPNKLIYRHDDINGEYYVRFSKEEIEKIASKFNEDLNNRNINFMHTEVIVDGFVAQNWLIESDQDKSKGLGFDLPEGSWFGAVKIKDGDFWQDKVKSDEVKGFSVEILADLQLSLKNNKEQMKKLKLGKAILGDGMTRIYFDGEIIEVGKAIFTDEALTIPAEDDRWVLEDGRTIVVSNGVVESIEDSNPSEGEEDLQEEGGIPEGGATTLTPEEVSAMIDSRFNEIMEEITRLKGMIESMTGDVAEFKKEVNVKFSTTPAAPSIKNPEAKIDDKFSKDLERVRMFSKNL